MRFQTAVAFFALQAFNLAHGQDTCPAAVTTTQYVFTTASASATGITTSLSVGEKSTIYSTVWLTATVLPSSTASYNATTTTVVTVYASSTSSLGAIQSLLADEREREELLRSTFERDIARQRREISDVLATCPGVSVITTIYLSTLTNTYETTSSSVTSFDSIGSSMPPIVSTGSTESLTSDLTTSTFDSLTSALTTETSESSTSALTTATSESSTSLFADETSETSTSASSTSTLESSTSSTASSAEPSTSLHTVSTSSSVSGSTVTSKRKSSTSYHTAAPGSTRTALPTTIRSSHTRPSHTQPPSDVSSTSSIAKTTGSTLDQPLAPSSDGSGFAYPQLWTTFTSTTTSCTTFPCWYSVPDSMLTTISTITFPKYKTSVCATVCETIFASDVTVDLAPSTVSIISFLGIQVTEPDQKGLFKAMPLLGPQSTSIRVPAPWDICPQYHNYYDHHGKCGKHNNFRCPKKQCCGEHGQCGTGKVYCDDGCQINYGDCWKNSTKKKCLAPKKQDDHDVPAFIAWGGGGSGFNFGFWFRIAFRCPLPLKILQLCPVSCPAVLKALHLCNPGHECGSNGCDGLPSNSWLDPVAPPPGPPPPPIGVSGGGQECSEDMKQCKPPDFDEPNEPDECSTTYSATDRTEFCTKSTINSIHRTKCTRTEQATRTECSPVTGTTTTLWNSCKTPETATDFTYSCSIGNRTDSNGLSITQFTTCTKTVSAAITGCSVSATTTSIIDEGPHCPYLGDQTPTPDDSQGEEGTETDQCPLPGADIPSPDESQGEDGSLKSPSCPYANFTVSPLDDQGEDGAPEVTSCPLANITITPLPANDTNATCSYARQVSVMAGGVPIPSWTPHPDPTLNVSDQSITCNGLAQQQSVLQSEINSLISAGISALSLWTSALQQSAGPTKNAACEVMSFEKDASRLEACSGIMDELSSSGWGRNELSSLTSLKSGHSSLHHLLSSMSSRKFCAPACADFRRFWDDIRGEYSSLKQENAIAIRLLTSAANDPDGEHSSLVASAICAMTAVENIKSRASACPEVASIIATMSWNPESDLSIARSLRSNIMSSWKNAVSCPTSTTTDWSDWWIPLDFWSHHSECKPPTDKSLPSCTKVILQEDPNPRATGRAQALKLKRDTTDVAGLLSFVKTKSSTGQGHKSNKQGTDNDEGVDLMTNVDYSCECGTVTTVLPTLTGKNCGTRLFCVNEITGTLKILGPTHLDPPPQSTPYCRVTRPACPLGERLPPLHRRKERSDEFCKTLPEKYWDCYVPNPIYGDCTLVLVEMKHSILHSISPSCRCEHPKPGCKGPVGPFELQGPRLTACPAHKSVSCVNQVAVVTHSGTSLVTLPFSNPYDGLVSWTLLSRSVPRQRRATNLAHETMTPKPGSVPEAMAKDTSRPIKTKAATTSHILDESSTLDEVWNGSKPSSKLANVQPIHDAGKRSAATVGSTPGLPRWLRGSVVGNKGVQTSVLDEQKRQIVVVEVRQLLSQAAELQSSIKVDAKAE